MLVLLTGIPGYGKTAHAIDWVFFQETDFVGLDRYVEGISQLDNVKCPHFLLPSMSELRSPDFVPLSSVDADDDEADKYKPWLPSHPEYQEHLNNLRTAKHPLELWYLWVQKGSVVVVDEAQRFYRPRPSGSKVPLHVAMFEYHRHFGCHFLFISQAPRLMDLHLRSLTEKHVHLSKTWKGGVKYEWPGVRDIDSRVDKIDAAKSSYKPPSHVFPLYQSSSLHLKVKHKIPKLVFIVAAAVLLFAVAGSVAVYKIKHDKITDIKPKPIAASGVPSSDVLDSVSGVQVDVHDFSPAAVDRYLEKFKPLVPALPESAHAYDAIRKVSVMPRVVACVSMGEKCRCYSQQGSFLPEIPLSRCSQLSVDGVPFNPYEMASNAMPSESPASIGAKSQQVTPPNFSDSLDDTGQAIGQTAPIVVNPVN